MSAENSSSSSKFGNHLFAGRADIGALFSVRSDAEKAVDDLKAAGFDEKEISLKRRAASAIVRVSDPERLADAATILQRHGGQVGQPAEEAGAVAPTAQPTEDAARPHHGQHPHGAPLDPATGGETLGG
jgi:hypothetical protein